MAEHILIASLVSYGWCASFWDDMIFSRIGDWLEERLPVILTEPMFACPVCNSFWVGTVLYWLWWGGNNIFEWLILAIGATGLSAAIVNLTRNN